MLDWDAKLFVGDENKGCVEERQKKTENCWKLCLLFASHSIAVPLSPCMAVIFFHAENELTFQLNTWKKIQWTNFRY